MNSSSRYLKNNSIMDESTVMKQFQSQQTQDGEADIENKDENSISISKECIELKVNQNAKPQGVVNALQMAEMAPLPNIKMSSVKLKIPKKMFDKSPKIMEIETDSVPC